MAKIRKIYDQTIKPDGSKTTIYPITSTRAVYTPEGETLDSYLKDGYFHGADLRGYKTVSNVTDLPTTENQFGWLIGEDLYVWVGTGGDTLGGLYKNCGHFRTPYVPDDEDLVANSDNELKLKDRTVEDGGMGYVVLRKNKTFAEQVIYENTIYEIRYDFTLGANVTIPENCILKFNGGSVSGAYALTGQNTKIQASKNQIFSGVGIAGTWNVPCIYSVWFANITNNNEIKKLFALTNAEVENTVFVEQGNYRISVSAANQSVICLNNNTDVILNGTITLDSNGYEAYKIIQINGCSNITVSGSGSIVGDKDTHAGVTGEYGHGINIAGSRNICIKGLSISKCWGDGIYVGPGNINYDIRIEGCEIYDCRRQGISLAYSSRVEIVDCYIHDISGTNPQSCIDIEPNAQGEQHVEICKIVNCRFVSANDCIHVTSFSADNPSSDVTIDGCYIESTAGFALYVNYYGSNINVNNCSIVGKVYNYERVANRANPTISYTCNTITTNYLYNQYARFINNKITTIGNGIMRGSFRDNYIIINLDANEKACFRAAPVLINNRIQVVYTDDNYEALFEFSGNDLTIGEFESNTILFPTDGLELLCSKFAASVTQDWIKRNIKDVMLRSRNSSNCTLLHVDENIKLSTKNNLPVVTSSLYRTYSPVIGEKLFDTTAGKEIVYNGVNWIDAAGNIIY